MRGAIAMLLGVTALVPPANGGSQPAPSVQPAQSAAAVSATKKEIAAGAAK